MVLDLKKIGGVRNVFIKYKVLFFFVLVLAALGYVGGIYYFYVIEIKVSSVELKKTTIDRALAQKVSDYFVQREMNFLEEETKTYKDPFK
ncbi:MAG: hypothetical protein A2174_01310 [Candidatus Portnoybacteria bacterium RBG_13_41_18]|uniref:Uncharacterized protein n=1 Tax=Candidatus Portnoybacteria bacterium RBG_13_41_18 TaxID=1801991 RepID=A0A1G2F699_9BACT|nr:MAG: hypothetical protein A2174_01310 [Candidatus Portnoybacteria bacterium RBG_13_41_18]